MATAAPLAPPTPSAMRKVIVVAIIPKTLGNFESQEMVGFAYLNETWQNFFLRYKIPVGREHIVCSQERGPNGWEVQMNTVVKLFIDKYSIGKCPYTVRLRTSRTTSLNPVNIPIPVGRVPNMFLGSPGWNMPMLGMMGISGLQQPTFTQNRVSEARGSPHESQDNSVPDEAVDLSTDNNPGPSGVGFGQAQMEASELKKAKIIDRLLTLSPLCFVEAEADYHMLTPTATWYSMCLTMPKLTDLLHKMFRG